ncbi:MAG: hypothetical protein LUE21_08390 [Oscillospiraceae bacterium]|nr:hypothetical protein [Oscillospiraceae bacterium]
MKKLLSILLCLCLVFSLGTMAFASEEATGEVAASDADAALTITDPAWELSADGSYYSLTNVQYCTNVVNATYQYMNIYVPAAYIDGGECNGYTAETAPIIIENNCMGWNSSSPSGANTTYLAEGFVFVSVGARSRNAEDGTGKMPAPVVDQKSAVRCLRLNDGVIPGDKEKIISLGSSGGGQMSSILGATGNMAAYYEDLYEAGAAGIVLNEDGTYTSTIRDDIYGSMCFCPIADLNNADLAYAWMWYDQGATSVATMSSGTIEFSEFQLALQEDLAVAYCEYINSLGLVNEEGEALTFDLTEDGTPDPRSGSYYDQILENISDALNAWIEAEGYADSASGEAADSWESYYATLSDPESWLVQNEDGTWSVTDMAGFLNGTGLARNKDIPGFDTFFATEEGNGFGTAEEDGVHFSASVAAVLEANYDEYSTLEGFDEQDVDAYIEQASREDIQEQAYLMNATQIMLAVAAGEEEADPAPYWRTRNGTADQHTSFSIAYNLCLSALAAGSEIDYSLVWDMPHGSDEGESTGTFIEWVHAICAEDGADTAEAASDTELSDGGWPLSGSGDTSMDAYKAYLKAYMDCVPEMDGHEEELYGLIDAENFEAPVAMAFEDWFEENAMSYDEFVAADGVYALHYFGETSPAEGDPT